MDGREPNANKTVIKIDTRQLSHAEAKKLMKKAAKNFSKCLKYDANTGRVLTA